MAAAKNNFNSWIKNECDCPINHAKASFVKLKKNIRNSCMQLIYWVENHRMDQLKRPSVTNKSNLSCNNLRKQAHSASSSVSIHDFPFLYHYTSCTEVIMFASLRCQSRFQLLELLFFSRLSCQLCSLFCEFLIFLILVTICFVFGAWLRIAYCDMNKLLPENVSFGTNNTDSQLVLKPNRYHLEINFYS